MALSFVASTKCDAWLRRELSALSAVSAAYIFGSALLVEQPNDVDLCIVTDVVIGTNAWKRIRFYRNSLSYTFKAVFGVRLSVMIITRREWKEIDGVIVRERHALI